MSSNSNSHASEENVVTEPQGTISSVPKMVKPITTVPPTKPKKKASSKSAIKKKKPSKSKKGESKVPLTINDLYVKENLFESISVKADVDTSMKESKAGDVEANTKTAPTATTSESKKGNLDETLTTYIPKSAKKLGL